MSSIQCVTHRCILLLRLYDLNYICQYVRSSQLLKANLHEAHCNPSAYTSLEDVYVAVCLYNLGPHRVEPYDTRDERQRWVLMLVYFMR